MNSSPIRCLILACGNPLRGDDGIGPLLASWAEERFRANPAVRVIARQQWTPELAEDIAQAGSVLFVDASTATSAGAIQLDRLEPNLHPSPLDPTFVMPALASHHLDAGQLLDLCRQLYSAMPGHALLLTIGIESTDLGSTLSKVVDAAIPQAQTLMEMAVTRLLEAESKDSKE